jgi:hypothetical protein
MTLISTTGSASIVKTFPKMPPLMGVLDGARIFRMAKSLRRRRLDFDAITYTWTPLYAKRFFSVLVHRNRLLPYIRPVSATRSRGP